MALGIRQEQGGLSMFLYDKKLQYPVKIDNPNPKLAAIIISQYGGPDGELGASLRYLSQRYSMPFDEPKGTNAKKSHEINRFHGFHIIFEAEYGHGLQHRLPISFHDHQ